MHSAHMATFDTTITHFDLGLVNAHKATNSDNSTNAISSKEIHASFKKKVKILNDPLIQSQLIINEASFIRWCRIHSKLLLI